MNKDPYAILGVARTATQDEIKRSYRRLAKEHHPDRNPGDHLAESRFKEIQAAYEVLGDTERRAEYDRFGAGGPRPRYQQWNAHARPGHETQFDFGDLSSIFEQFFQRGAAGASRRRTPTREADAPLEHTIELTFDETVRGAGRVLLLDAGGPRPERVEFRIPAGVIDGQRIRVSAGGTPVVVRCKVQPHAYFRREGNDLLLDLPVTLSEALLGTRVTIPTYDGPMSIQVPPGASGGVKLRVRGRGIRNQRTGETGDLYAVLRIVLPRNPTEKLRALAEALAAEQSDDPRAGLGWSLK